MGFEGSYDRVAAVARTWREGQSERVNPASKRTGEYTAKMLGIHLERSRNFMSGYRTTEGMKSLCKQYGGQRLEEVCCYALANSATSISDVRTILSKKLDHLLPRGFSDNPAPEIAHGNIRGAEYYARILNATKENEHDE